MILSLATLFSCGEENDVPEGMQLVSGGEDKGYYFFAPEEWTVGKEMNGINYVYASRVNTTSVSFAEINPESFIKPDPSKSDEDFFLEDYFNSTKSEFPEKTVFGEENGKGVILGAGDTKADKAVKYTYNYIVKSPYTEAEERVAFMQIFASHRGSFYILTYAASLEERAGEETTIYDYYFEKFQAVIDNFRFTDKKDSAEEKTEYTHDSEGDILASDEKLAGFSLYVPSDFNVDYSSAIVSATHADGSNITMTKATATGNTIGNYWELRKKELSFYVDSITDLGENPREIEFANAQNAVVCEYTYNYNGDTYRVYQIFCVSKGLLGTNLSAKGYIFTYTALEDNFDLHFDDIDRILKKVKI